MLTAVLGVVVALQTAGLVALGVLLGVSQRRLGRTRRALRDRPRRRPTPEDTPRRRRPRTPAELAVRTVARTVSSAETLVRRQLTEPLRSSIEDLAGWARIERPDLPGADADGPVVLVFSDIEGSTARNAALGDRRWVDLLDRHEKVVRGSVARHGGSVVKNQGDGFMMAFADPVAAVRCCLALQERVGDDDIRVRIGGHIGTSVRRGDDFFGLDVATAARVAGHAEGGQILVSDALRRSVGEEAAFGEPCEVELKGLDGPQTVWEVTGPR